MNRLFRLCVVLVVLLQLTGCSRIKIAYNWGDWFIANRVDSYFDLDSTQEELVDKELNGFFVWHRKSMLPGFAQYFRQQAANLRASRMGEMEYRIARDGFLGLFFGTMEGVYPGAARVLVTLRPEQVSHYEAKINKDNAERAKELDRDQNIIQAERAETTVKFLRRWIGYMPEKQKEEIRNYSKQLVWPGKEWHELRIQNQKRFFALLRGGATTNQLEAYLRQIVMQPEARASKVFQAKMTAFNEKSVDIVVKILGTLDATQRNFLASKFDDFASDFDELAAQN